MSQYDEDDARNPPPYGPPPPPPPGTYTLEESLAGFHAWERARIRTRRWRYVHRLHCRLRGHKPEQRLDACARCGRRFAEIES